MTSARRPRSAGWEGRAPGAGLRAQPGAGRGAEGGPPVGPPGPAWSQSGLPPRGKGAKAAGSASRAGLRPFRAKPPSVGT